MAVEGRRSSGNVFRDLGFGEDEAENLKIRADLMIELTKLIEARELTQAAAAKLLGVTQPRVSDLMRGKIDRFSVDSLIEMLGHAGARVSAARLLAMRSGPSTPCASRRRSMSFTAFRRSRPRACVRPNRTSI